MLLLVLMSMACSVQARQVNISWMILQSLLSEAFSGSLSFFTFAVIFLYFPFVLEFLAEVLFLSALLQLQ